MMMEPIIVRGGGVLLVGRITGKMPMPRVDA